MKRSLILRTFVVFWLAALVTAQDIQQASAPSDPYKSTLDRLQWLTSVPLPQWKIHSDVAHPEDSSLDDSAGT